MATTTFALGAEIFVRSDWGNAWRSSRKTPLVHPNPTMFSWYPTLTFDSDDRVTTLYFSRIVPSRRKFSTMVPSHATLNRFASSSKEALRMESQKGFPAGVSLS